MARTPNQMEQPRAWGREDHTVKPDPVPTMKWLEAVGHDQRHANPSCTDRPTTCQTTVENPQRGMYSHPGWCRHVTTLRPPSMTQAKGRQNRLHPTAMKSGACIQKHARRPGATTSRGRLGKLVLIWTRPTGGTAPQGNPTPIGTTHATQEGNETGSILRA